MSIKLKQEEDQKNLQKQDREEILEENQENQNQEDEEDQEIEEEEEDDNDEEEDEDDEQNDYQKDEFVVSDHQIEEEDEDFDEEEIKKRKKKKKRKEHQTIKIRKLKKVQKNKEEKDLEDELDLSEKLEDYHEEGSDQENIKKQKIIKKENQAQYNKNEDEEDFQIDEEIEGQIEANTNQTYQNAFQNLFLDKEKYGDQWDDEGEIKSDIEENENINEEFKLEEIFEPSEIANRYDKEIDSKIKKEDIPERLQLRMLNRKQPDKQELLDEMKWISEKMSKTNDQFNNNSEKILKIILKILEAIHNEKQEIMYIYTYKKNEFYPYFTLYDLWKILDLDAEWAQFYKLKIKIIHLISQVQEHVEKNPHLIQENVINEEQNKRVIDYFEKTNDITTLQFIKDYFDYLLIKIFPVEMHKRMKLKKVRNNRMVNTYIKSDLHNFVNLTTLPPYKLHENLINNKIIHQPDIQKQRPSKFADLLVQKNPTEDILNEQLKALYCMSDFQSAELFYYPPLKKYILDQYKEKYTISTEPTEQGKKQIDIFSQYYPIKRIQNRDIKSFVEDHWILVEEALKLNFISINFKPKKKQDLNKQFSDEIVENLYKYYTIQIKKDSQQKEQNIEWNVFRKFNLDELLQRFMYPFVQLIVKNELHEQAEKWVINQSANKFHDLLNVQPYSLSNSTERIMSVVQDTNGKVGVVFLDENGIFKDQIILNFFNKSDEQLITKARQDKGTEETILKDKINRYRPNLIVVAANSIESQKLKNNFTKLKEQFRDIINFVMYGDDTIPQMVSKSPQQEKEIQFKEHVVRVAVSLGRMILNPTSEILVLWSERTNENGCLHIPLHTSKEFISLDKLKNALEKEAVQIVNQTGVDYEKIVQHQHLSHLLQFICGFGPRKTIQALENNKFQNDKSSYQMQRSYFMECFNIEKIIFTNMNGFIRVIQSPDPLDKSRINKEQAKIARKICNECIEDNEKNIYTDDDKTVKYIMENYRRLNGLDMDDYAKQLETRRQQNNMKPVLDFIIAELSHPFKDERKKHEQMRNEDLFFKMIKENPQTFRKGMIVSAKIYKIAKSEKSHGKGHATELHVKILENDLKSSKIIIDNEEEANKHFEGEIIKAYIQEIGVLDQQKKNQDEKDKSLDLNILSIKLSLHEPNFEKLLKETHPQLYKNYIEQDRTFLAIEQEDKPIGIEVKEKKVRKFEPRKITHPNFKNMSIGDAIKYIKNSPIGEFIIRPSSNSKNHLIVTWKFYEDVYVHLSLKEEQIPDKIGTRFVLNDREKFENFDELIERYIIPCNTCMQSVMKHRKFLNKSLEEIEASLKQENEQNPDTIHYYFCCSSKYPQYVVLLCCYKAESVTKEWIKVKHEGLYFHENYFNSLKELIYWFKHNFHKPEYKKYVKKVKEPLCQGDSQYKNTQGGIGSSYGGIKQEIGTKYEKYEGGYAQKKCNNCGKTNHTAATCKMRSSSTFSNAGPKCHTCKSNEHLTKDCRVNLQNKTQKRYSSRSRSRSKERK